MDRRTLVDSVMETADFGSFCDRCAELHEDEREAFVDAVLQKLRRRIAAVLQSPAPVGCRDIHLERMRVFYVMMLLDRGLVAEAVEAVGTVADDDAIEAAKVVVKYLIHRAVPSPTGETTQLNLLSSRLRFDSAAPYDFLRRTLARPAAMSGDAYYGDAAAVLTALVQCHAAAAIAGGGTGRLNAAVYYLRLLVELGWTFNRSDGVDVAWNAMKPMDGAVQGLKELLLDHELTPPWSTG